MVLGGYGGNMGSRSSGCMMMGRGDPSTKVFCNEIYLDNTARILSLAERSGMPSAISRSNRPARRSAGSSESGRLVAPITTT